MRKQHDPLTMDHAAWTSLGISLPKLLSTSSSKGRTDRSKRVLLKKKKILEHLLRAGLLRAVGNCTNKKLIMDVPGRSAALTHSWASFMRQWSIAWFAMQLPRFRSEQAERDNIQYLYLKPVTFDLTRKSNKTSLVPRMVRKRTMSAYK